MVCPHLPVDAKIAHTSDSGLSRLMTLAEHLADYHRPERVKLVPSVATQVGITALERWYCYYREN